MASIIPSLIIGALPRLGVEPAMPGGLETWLNKATLVPDSPSDPRTVCFTISNAEVVVPFLTFDYERFGLAAAESFSRATFRPKGPLNQAGWRLLELYYSAFFAAHAITRSQGAGVTQISAATARRIATIADLYGSTSEPMQPGSWFYRIDFAENDDPTIVFRPVVSGSGVHDSFWREFCLFLKTSAAIAVRDQLPDSTEFLIGADEIASRIRIGDDGSASWLSKVRNEINYKHALSTWYPEPKKQEASNAIDAVKLLKSSAIRMDVSKSKEPLLAFASTCGFLASLSFELSNYVAERSTAGGAFGQKWRRFKEMSRLKLHP